ncbi:MAG: winged helix-turn-helix transcriptional regulator [Acidobacteria bacterium]|nr:winged helix-turn-helix transcriptional regulator [Acidobacteriota bacterium]
MALLDNLDNIIQDTEKAAECFQVLANSTRLLIIELLLNGEMSVNDIAAACDQSQPNISQHLRLMRDRGILKSTRDGSLIKYSLKDRRLKDVLQKMKEIFCK